MAQFEDAVARLRERILSGELQPGDRLVAEEVAAELGMSRSPLREAFRSLASEGLVELTHNRGARVSAWSADEVAAQFEVRVLLEGLAVRRAAARIMAEEADRLEEIALEIRELSNPLPPDLTEVQRLNTEFHSGIIRIAGSASLATAVAGVVHASVLNRARQSFDALQQQRSDADHLEIVAALRAGDAEWAESVMHSHLLSARTSLLGPRRELL
ncbi:MAG: GntR family transcriptional regulator [Actinomycetota bacterium]|nr:GntR family transcriptional regulator [Actinomycetota bacterium]